MLLSRSLTSPSGNTRSTRASPSTSPPRVKYPTPLLNRTTRVTGSATAGLTSFTSPAPASPLAAVSRVTQHPTPAAASTGSAHNALRIDMTNPREDPGRAGSDETGDDPDRTRPGGRPIHRRPPPRRVVTLP